MLIAANYGEPFSFSLSSFPRFSVELVERMDNENGVQQYQSAEMVSQQTETRPRASSSSSARMTAFFIVARLERTQQKTSAISLRI